MPDSKYLTNGNYNSDPHALMAQVYLDLSDLVRYAFLHFHQFPTPDEIEDLRDEITLRLLADDGHRLKTFDPNQASLKTWLTKVVEHFVEAYLKRQRTWDSLEDILPEKLWEQPRQELNVITQEQRIAVAREVAKLSARQRQLYTLLCEDLSPVEIAKCLNIKPASVHRMRYNLILKIQAGLKNGGGQIPCQRF